MFQLRTFNTLVKYSLLPLLVYNLRLVVHKNISTFRLGYFTQIGQMNTSFSELPFNLVLQAYLYWLRLKRILNYKLQALNNNLNIDRLKIIWIQHSAILKTIFIISLLTRVSLKTLLFINNIFIYLNANSTLHQNRLSV